MLRMLAVFLLVAPGVAAAERVPVYVSSTAEDLVGGRLVYQIKEALRASHGMSLATSQASSVITLSIVTLDPGEGDPALSTIFSAVWYTKADIFLHHLVGLSGSSRIEEQAATLVAKTDNILETRFSK